MLIELLVRFVIVAFDGRLPNRPVHSLNLSFRPRMINFRQTMFNFVLKTDAVK